MELTNEKIIQAKKFNSKIFPIYKLFAWDLLFYYSISFLFLTQNKGLSASQVLFAEAFYPIFKLVSQIPCVNIIEIIGKRKSLILGNISVALGILFLILGSGISSAIIFNIITAFGYSIKGIGEATILSDFVQDEEHPRTAYADLDGKGSSYWYCFDGITAFFCGFLYVFNNYLPIILSLVSALIGALISFKFLPYQDENVRETLDETKSFKSYVHDLKVAFKHIFKSDRLKALILFSGMFYALLLVRSTIASSLFTEIGISEEYFGVIFAVLTLLSGISSRYQEYFHKKFRNKLLTYFSLAFSISMVVIGLTAIISDNFIFSIIIILFAYAVQYIIKGPYYTLQKRYLNSFSTPSMSPKIFSADVLVEGIFGAVMYWIASFLLSFINTSTTIVILGCIFTIAFIFVLDYMRTRIGLKPEEYKKSDIYFTEVH